MRSENMVVINRKISEKENKEKWRAKLRKIIENKETKLCIIKG